MDKEFKEMAKITGFRAGTDDIIEALYKYDVMFGELRKIVEEMRLVAKVNSEKKPSIFDDVVQAKTREEESTFWADKIEQLLKEAE
jgi:hypothetical protein